MWAVCKIGGSAGLEWNTWLERPCLSVSRVWPDATCARACAWTSGSCVCGRVWPWQVAEWPREKIKLNFSLERSSAGNRRARPCAATPSGCLCCLGSTSSAAGAGEPVVVQGATGRGSEWAQGAILTGGGYLGEDGGDLDGCRGSAAGPGPHTECVWPSASADSAIRGDGRHPKFAHLAIHPHPPGRRSE